jgi:hypothetical protein
MSILSAGRYRDICQLIDGGLDHADPVVREAGAAFEWPVGVYAVGHREAAGSHLDIGYVGSAVRRNGDVASRVREHLRDEEKALAFSSQVLFPLREDLSVAEVRRIEGVVARALGVPRWCQRVPGGRG